MLGLYVGQIPRLLIASPALLLLAARARDRGADLNRSRQADLDQTKWIRGIE